MISEWKARAIKAEILLAKATEKIEELMANKPAAKKRTTKKKVTKKKAAKKAG